MNGRFFLSVLLLCFYSTCTGMQKVKTPSAEKIKTLLERLDLDDFAENTQIVIRLANQTLTAQRICTIIDVSLYDYDESLKKAHEAERVLVDHARSKKSQILEALLKNSAEPLKQ